MRVSLHLVHLLLSDESGQDILEYALLAAFIGLGVVAAERNLATAVCSVFNGIGTTLTSSL